MPSEIVLIVCFDFLQLMFVANIKIIVFFLLQLWSNKKSIIIELKYDINSKSAYDQIIDKKYAHKVSKKYETIIIGLNVSKDKSVDIRYKIIRVQ